MNQHKVALTADRVRPLLGGRFGEPYVWSAACPSTQDVLRDADLPEGAVAVTEHQTAGRGREGRRWEDEPGASVLVSVMLRPPAGRVAPQLSLVCALAVAETVEQATGHAARVKWPNDVLVDGRKVAGILLEGRADAVACGIGINVNQEEATLPDGGQARAASLLTLTGREHDRAAILADLLARLEVAYDAWLADGLAGFLPVLERRDALRDRAVSVGRVSGTANGIAPDGRLRVVGADGTETLVSSGQVTGSDPRDANGSDPEGV